MEVGLDHHEARDLRHAEQTKPVELGKAEVEVTEHYPSKLPARHPEINTATPWNEPSLGSGPSKRRSALHESTRGCISRRMARMQVYLPDDLYQKVKARGLPASELLQKAVRAELRRLELLAETERYVEQLVADVGAPTEEELREAQGVAHRIARRRTRKAG